MNIGKMSKMFGTKKHEFEQHKSLYISDSSAHC